MTLFVPFVALILFLMSLLIVFVRLKTLSVIPGWLIKTIWRIMQSSQIRPDSCPSKCFACYKLTWCMVLFSARFMCLGPFVNCSHNIEVYQRSYDGKRPGIKLV